MSTAVTEYVNRIASASPQEAVKIAIAESERQNAIAEQASAQYKAMAEVEFDEAGRIARANMAGLYRMAQAYARSQIIPQHYQQKPDDCFIACQMAMQLKVHPLAYMQNSYIVHGRPGVEAKMTTALLNTSGLIKGRIRYTLEHDKDRLIACTAKATDAESGEEVSARVDWKMVEAEGWQKNKGTQVSKWQTMPEVMFHYRAATFLIRRHYPEVMMGMHTVDELEDISEAKPVRTLTDLNAAIAEVEHGNGQQAAESGKGEELPVPETPFAPKEDDQEQQKREAFEAECRRRMSTAKTEMEFAGIIQDIDNREDWLGPYVAGSLRDEYRQIVEERQQVKGKKK